MKFYDAGGAFVALGGAWGGNGKRGRSVTCRAEISGSGTVHPQFPVSALGTAANSKVGNQLLVGTLAFILSSRLPRTPL